MYLYLSYPYLLMLKIAKKRNYFVRKRIFHLVVVDVVAAADFFLEFFAHVPNKYKVDKVTRTFRRSTFNLLVVETWKFFEFTHIHRK